MTINDFLTFSKDYQPLITASATIFAALTAAFVAITVGVGQLRIARAQKDIANEQRRIASDKLRLDLFDRRLAVFDKLQNTIRVAETQNTNMEDVYRSFSETISRARFLFPESLTSYLDNLHNKSLRIKGMEYKMKAQVVDHVEFEKILTDVTQERIHFEELTAELNGRFEPFLSFGHISREGRSLRV